MKWYFPWQYVFTKAIILSVFLKNSIKHFQKRKLWYFLQKHLLKILKQKLLLWQKEIKDLVCGIKKRQKRNFGDLDYEEYCDCIVISVFIFGCDNKFKIFTAGLCLLNNNNKKIDWRKIYWAISLSLY